ncbi:MAG: hypothetical protein KJO07_20400, partial [Deltaproteobacteria bacterium]|nr:hypothetical protein [Deltaproteobacteria bacterium]
MRIAVVVGLLWTLVAGPARADRHQVNWSPNRYRVKCKNKPNCLPRDLVAKVQKVLPSIASTYRALSWKPTSNFGPVRSPPRDLSYVEVHDPNEDGWAWVHARCAARTTSVLNIGRKLLKIDHKPWVLHYFLAHELFHLIQVGYRAFNQPDANLSTGKFCGRFGGAWVSESTATEVGLHLTRKRFGKLSLSGLDADLKRRMKRNLAGLRRYSVPLNDKRSVYSAHRAHYYTQSFWRHLAEIHFGDSRDYLKRFLARRPKSDDWLEWLNDNLKSYAGIELGPVFTIFLADFAGWWRKGHPGEDFKQHVWLQAAFAGCPLVVLDPEKPARVLNTSLQRVAGRCVNLQLRGLTKERVTVRIAALTPAGADHSDQIHLGVAEARDSKPFVCADALRAGASGERLGAMFRCLQLGNTGSVKLGSTSFSAKVWDVFSQYPKKGKLYNRYVVTRVAPKPTDFGNNDGGKNLKVTLVFSADFSSKKVAGRSSGKTVAHLNEEAPFEAQEKVPKYNKRGGKSMPLLYPHAPRQQVIPKIPLHPASRGNKKGIWVMRVTDVTATRSGPGSENLRAGDELAVFPVTGDEKSSRPLQVGDRGSFKAHIQGRVGRRPVVTETPATIKVREFSNYVLNARVTGTLCEAQLVARSRNRNRCKNPRSVDLTIVKGLAGWHMPRQKYAVEDTPSTKQYRAFVKKIIDGYMGAQAQSGGGGGSSSGSGGSAAGGKVFKVTG